MPYAPPRALGASPQRLTREEAALLARGLPTLVPISMRREHQASHFEIVGDAPASYVATLGRSRFAGLTGEPSSGVVSFAAVGSAVYGGRLGHDLRLGEAPPPRPASASSASSSSSAPPVVSATTKAAALAAACVPASAVAPRARRTLGAFLDDEEEAGAGGGSGPTFVQLPATGAPAPAYVLETQRPPSAFLNPRAQRHLHASLATVSGLGGNTERHSAMPEPRPSAKKTFSRTAAPSFAPFATVASIDLAAPPSAHAAAAESSRSTGRRHVGPAEREKERIMFGWA